MDTPPYEDFRAALREAQNIIVLAGAGLSAASGIPTFRGAGGLWRTHDSIKLASPEAFAKDPSIVWQFYHYRRNIVFQAEPNLAHKAIALLCSSLPHLRRVAPKAVTPMRLVTQNVDGLSTRVLPHDPVPADVAPIEVHGNLARVKCTACSYVGYDYNDPICPALGDVNINLEEGPNIPQEELPHCPQCNSLLRPGVVWFGEEVENLEEAADLIVHHCDLLLVVGTSAIVYPVGVLPDIVREDGGKVAIFNIEPPAKTRKPSYDFLFLGPCEEMLIEALGLKDLNLDNELAALT